MKEHLLICLLPLLVVWLAMPSIIQAHPDVDPCRFFANGTKLRHPEDCGQQIICNDFKSVDGLKCTGSKPFYNKDTNECQAHLTDNSTCAINCNNMTGKFVTDPRSCFGYYYCQDEKVALYSRCPASLHFNETLQSCINTYQSYCSVSKLNFCAIVSTGVKFKDDTDCGRYYICTQNIKTKRIELKNEYCSANVKYFNAVKGACAAEPTSTDCHPVPKDVCIVNKKIKKNYFVSDHATCQGSFYCAHVGNFSDPNPRWHQCPGNKFFSEAKQMCLDPKQVPCLKDRCEGSTRAFVISSQRGCRHYINCDKGVKVGEGTCGNNFFDEERGLCTSDIVTYPACYYK